MITNLTKNKKMIRLKKLDASDLPALALYLDELSAETKQKFAPHGFALTALEEFYQHPLHNGFVAYDVLTGQMVAYSVVKAGLLAHDLPRLNTYNIQLQPQGDVSFAPSVADEWQGARVGSLLYDFIRTEFSRTYYKRVFLWGGVQASNWQAIRFYQNKNFIQLGEFEYNGMNWDMMANWQ
jgi:diamine N-acetyltransferase